MTTDTYIQQNKTETFKKGDSVLMQNCYEATFKENKGKIWICQTDSFLAKDKSDVVFLEDFSGYFFTAFLIKIPDENNQIPLIPSKQ
jgi:hypothetical protein